MPAPVLANASLAAAEYYDQGGTPDPVVLQPNLTASSDSGNLVSLTVTHTALTPGEDALEYGIEYLSAGFVKKISSATPDTSVSGTGVINATTSVLIVHDLSEMSSTQVLRATLVLPGGSDFSGPTPFGIQVYRNTQSFNSSTVTWNTAPTHDAEPLFTYYRGVGADFEYDFTQVVDEDRSGTRQYLGLTLKLAPGSDSACEDRLGSAVGEIRSYYSPNPFVAVATTATSLTATAVGTVGVTYFNWLVQTLSYRRLAPLPPGAAPQTLTFSIVANDGSADSNVVARTVTVRPRQTLSHSEGWDLALRTTLGSAPLVPTLVISPAHEDVYEAKVYVSEAYLPGSDVLACEAEDLFGVNVTFFEETGLLLLFGAASVAQYTTLLRAVTLTCEAPPEDPAYLHKTVEFQITSDHGDLSESLSRGVSLSNFSGAPVTLPATPPQWTVAELQQGVPFLSGVSLQAANGILKAFQVEVGSAWDLAVDRLLYTPLEPELVAAGSLFLQPSRDQSFGPESAHDELNFLALGGTGYGALLQFDLSEVPAGAVPRSAALYLQCLRRTGTARTYSLYRNLASWAAEAETAPVTDDTRPFHTLSLSSRRVHQPQITPFAWDVLTAVQHWLCFPSENFGLLLQYPNEAAGDGAFMASTRAAPSVSGPLLVLTWESPTVTVSETSVRLEGDLPVSFYQNWLSRVRYQNLAPDAEPGTALLNKFLLTVSREGEASDQTVTPSLAITVSDAADSQTQDSSSAEVEVAAPTDSGPSLSTGAIVAVSVAAGLVALAVAIGVVHYVRTKRRQ